MITCPQCCETVKQGEANIQVNHVVFHDECFDAWREDEQDDG